MASGRVHAEGTSTSAGTLGVNREVAVGFSAIRLSFEMTRMPTTSGSPGSAS
jgi:hypothetical protein